MTPHIPSASSDSSADPPPPGRVIQGGRAKAYRPLAAEARAEALAAALDAYRRGDFFLAHELLEPAWMGTADPAERDLYQGLIKLSAAFVHAVRGNPTGVALNLQGARDRLAAAERAGPPAGATEDAGIDLPALLADVEDRLATAESLAGSSRLDGPRRPGEPARPPVPVEAPAIGRTAP